MQLVEGAAIWPPGPRAAPPRPAPPRPPGATGLEWSRPRAAMAHPTALVGAAACEGHRPWSRPCGEESRAAKAVPSASGGVRAAGKPGPPQPDGNRCEVLAPPGTQPKEPLKIDVEKVIRTQAPGPRRSGPLSGWSQGHSDSARRERGLLALREEARVTAPPRQLQRGHRARRPWRPGLASPHHPAPSHVARSPHTQPRPPATASSWTLPRPPATASSQALPQPPATASSQALPQPPATASSWTLPRPPATASSQALPQPPATASSWTLPQPPATASSRALPQPPATASSQALPQPPAMASSWTQPRPPPGPCPSLQPRPPPGPCPSLQPRPPPGPSHSLQPWPPPGPSHGLLLDPAPASSRGLLLPPLLPSCSLSPVGLQLGPQSQPRAPSPLARAEGDRAPGRPRRLLHGAFHTVRRTQAVGLTEPINEHRYGHYGARPVPEPARHAPRDSVCELPPCCLCRAGLNFEVLLPPPALSLSSGEAGAALPPAASAAPRQMYRGTWPTGRAFAHVTKPRISPG
ncbi:formin-like protein 5 [Dipodomys spectabilis]|uniref:formin-like protein 5 n=1 Tax=Dipodomys spectabilis TaxID=105255 RepID=UPI001C546837|nr:formin-like protein 5 [Dipodomys spectabilis]